MKIFLLALSGVCAGILGGMGMGGGTILIPVLTVFFGVEQKDAQAINLAAFIPMAVVSLAIHLKNKRVKTKGILWIIIPAAAFSASGSLIAQAINGEVLKRIFGGFLLALSALQFFSEEIIERLEKKNEPSAKKRD